MRKNIFIAKCLLLIIILICCLANIIAADTEYPQFSNYWDNNGTQIGTGTAYLNVTLISTNGVVILQFAGTNYPASNSSGDETVFNVTISSLSAGTYSYNWISYGNGTDTLYNISNTRDYTVNETPDIIPPYFTNLDNQILLGGQSLNYDINAADSDAGLGSFAINWTNTFSIIASTGVLTNASALPTGDYYINVSVNDTLGNLNSTILWINVIADTTAPIVSLVSPLDDSVKTLSSTVVFTYRVTDSNNIAACSLIINGLIDQSNSSAITKGTDQIFAKTMSNANYNWSVSCTDVISNIGNSSTYSLIVNYTAPSSTPPANEENLTTPQENTTPTNQTNNTNYTAQNNSGKLTIFLGTISLWINKLGGLIKSLIETVKSYLKMLNPDSLWIFMSISIIILLIIVIWQLRIALKKIKGRKIHKKEKKPRDIKENPKDIKEDKEIKKPIIKPPVEKKIIKPEDIIEKRIIKPGRFMVKGIIKPESIIEKRIIKPGRFMVKGIIKQEDIIEKRYKEDAEVENLKRKITNIERKQRIRILEQMRKQVRSNRK